MSRPLTPRERTLLIERIARELMWDEWPGQQSGHRHTAAVIVDAMMKDAISAATLKRAIDRVIETGLSPDKVA